MGVGKIGLVALAVAFLASGVYNVVKPQGTWKPTGADKEPPKDVLFRRRMFGVVFSLLGVLLAVYAVDSIFFAA